MKGNPLLRSRIARMACAVALSGAVCLSAGVSAAAADTTQWKPEAATYGVGQNLNIPVTMSDGTVLRVDEYYPTTASGAAAPGPFPVLLTQVPYGKSTAAEPYFNIYAYPNTYFVQRGYVELVADVRGTGDSQGTFGLFDPVQATDGATLVNWGAHLPNSNGSVGLFGASYFGINQLLTAAAVGPRSHLKAIFPELAGNDLYRDTAFFGGVFDAEFASLYFGEMANDNATNPVLETAGSTSSDPIDTAGVEMSHAAGLFSFQGALGLNAATGGADSYDSAYWMARNPRTMLRRIVANNIPAFLVGGWYDLFQRGELLNYSGLQNAFDHRPVGAPMLPNQPLTGRYQLLMESRYHLTCCDPPSSAVDDNGLQLAWFDQFLKGEDTGITDTSDPLHLYTLGTGKYIDTTGYPFPGAKPTKIYLGAGPSGSQASSTNDGTLSTNKPTGTTGQDPVVFTGATQTCDRQTEQWAGGAGAVGPEGAGQPDEPCGGNDAAKQAGPGSLTYTTAPFTDNEMIAGPIDAAIYATSTAPDTYLEATVEAIPSGSSTSSTSITSGGLLGSLRAVNHKNSWYAPDGNPLIPYHPYTQASRTPVPTGKVTRFDIEVFPTFAEIAKGDRLRLTITTSDSPHLMFNTSQLANLSGGLYEIQHNSSAASFLELPLAPASAYRKPCSLCANPLR